MKKKKLLAILAAGTLVLSMTACGGDTTGDSQTSDTSATESVATETPADTEVSETTGGAASIDFEDGNYGFASVLTSASNADPSELSVEEVNGSKALVVNTAAAKAGQYVGIDVNAILGDAVADVNSISFDVGTIVDGDFYAVSGNLYTCTGAGDITSTNAWSVYLETANPKNMKYDVGSVFTAGDNDYIIIAKETDNAKDSTGTPVNMYIDNITFYDASGNVITADTTASVAEDSPIYPKEDSAEEAVFGTVVALDSAYPGDWSANVNVIPAGVFEGATGAVNVTVDITLESGYDYYLMKPLTSWWTDLGTDVYTDLAVAEEGAYYHVQSDGFIVIDDWTTTQVSFAVNADAAAQYAAEGGMIFQLYGVTPTKAMVSEDTFVVPVDAAYAGDWSATVNPISAGVFENATEPVNVTVDIALESGYDYYLMKPLTSWWTDLGTDVYTDLAVAEEGAYYHVQSDGFIVIDDWTITSVSFAVNTDAAAQYAAEGGMIFQVYGVNVTKATVSQGSYVVPVDAAYAGDWSATVNPISAGVFEGATGPVNVTVGITLESGYDYYLMKPLTSWWTDLGTDVYTDLAVAEEGAYYHVQSDGFIVIDDWTITSVSFAITADAAAQYAAEGGMIFQVYGVNVTKATVSQGTYVVPIDAAYAGDWSANVNPISAGVFEGATGPVNVTVDITLESGYDYYLLKPLTSWWTDLGTDVYTDLTVAEEGAYYHVQSDGFIVIDDWTITSLSFAVNADAAAQYAAEGGMIFQLYGVNPTGATVIQ